MISTDLFETNASSATRLRDKGIKRAVDHANEVEQGWAYQAWLGLMDFLGTHDGEFMTEDVRAYACFVPTPPSRRAWGAVILRASRKGLVEMLGYGKTTNPKSHRTPASIWRKVK